MTAYYNEIDPYAAQWLRNLIAAGHIAPGVVDERSIADVRPDDLAGYTQCHFFAGIGGWSYAARLAGWPDDRPLWTGSCPCQPFSAAGKGGGFDDERHLWPHLHYLIEQCRPRVVLGEQVASKDGLSWFDLVQSDLEGSGYAAGAVDSCSAGFGAPHIRQRLYWMAYATDTGQQRWRSSEASDGRDAPRVEPERLCDASILGHTVAAGLQERVGLGGVPGGTRGNGAVQATVGAGVHIGELADANGGNASAKGLQRSGQHGLGSQDTGARDGLVATRPTNGFWSPCDWLLCRDGKWRPVEPGTFPLVNGASARVGRLRAYGNAINAEQAAAFCEAVLELCP